MIKVCAFKEKRKGRNKERPPTWWPMEGSKLSGPWNVPNLVVNMETSLFSGHWKEKYKHIFHLLLFTLIFFYLKSFPNYFKVLFYHGFRLLLCVVPTFPLTYKLSSNVLMYHVFHPFIVKLILIDFFF